MKAKPSLVNDAMFNFCDGCDEYSPRDEWDINDYYWHASSERVYLDGEGDRYYFDEECGSEEFGVCNLCGHRMMMSESGIRRGKGMWQCSNCAHWHESKAAGDECCV